MSQLVTIEELRQIQTPPATSTYQPIGHYDLSRSIRTISQDMLKGYDLIDERYEIARDGAQLFSVLTFGTDHSEMGLSVGYRNSLDKSMSVGICIGSQVYVCSNMMFSASNGGIVIMKKHSKNLLAGLEDLTITTLYKAQYTFAQLITDSEIMKSNRIGNDEAFRLMGWLYGYGLITPRQLPMILEHWQRSPHPAFIEDNVWRFYNACTEALKSSPPNNAMERHIGLHSALTTYCHDRQKLTSYQPVIEI